MSKLIRGIFLISVILILGLFLVFSSDNLAKASNLFDDAVQQIKKLDKNPEYIAQKPIRQIPTYQISNHPITNSPNNLRVLASILDQVNSFVQSFGNKVSQTISNLLPKPAPTTPTNQLTNQPTSNIIVATPVSTQPKPVTTTQIQHTIINQPIQTIIKELDDSKLNTLALQIENLKKSQQDSANNLFSLISQSSRINNLAPQGPIALTIRNATFTGTQSGLNDDSIPDDLSISTSKNLTAGNITSNGNLTVAGTISSGSGGSGTSFDGNVDITGRLKVGAHSIIINGLDNYISSPTNQLSIYTTSTPLALSAFTASSTFSSYVTGNFGIGTTTPGAGLSVAATSTILGGNTYIYGTTTVPSLNATSTLAVASSSPGSGVNLAVTGNSVLGGNVSVTGVLDVQGGLVTSGGLTPPVGIGSSSPALHLEVAGFGVVKGNWNVEATSTLGSLNATTTVYVATSSPTVNSNLVVGGPAYVNSLGVLGATNTPGDLFVKGIVNIGQSGNGISPSAANTLAFLTNGTERARIQSTGEFLVGITAPVTATDIAVFQKNQNDITRVWQRNTTAGTLSKVDFIAGSDTVNGSFGQSSSAFTTANGINANETYLINGTSGAGLLLQTNSAAPIRLSTNTTERARILSTGEILLGTTSVVNSGDFFEVVNNQNAATTGSVINTTSNTAASGNIQVLSGSGASAVNASLTCFSAGYTTSGSSLAGECQIWGSGSGLTGVAIRTSTADPVRFVTNDSERARILSTGEFGIGTTSPWGLLSVNPNGVSGSEFAVGSTTKTDFVVLNNGNVVVGSANPVHGLWGQPSGYKQLIVDNTSATEQGAVLSLRGNRTIANATAGAVAFSSQQSTDAANGNIIADILGMTPNSYDAEAGTLRFRTHNTGTTLATRMVITEVGDVGINITPPTIEASIGGTVLQVEGDPGNLLLTNANAAANGSISRLSFAITGGDVLQSLVAVRDGSASDAANLLFQTQATGGALSTKMVLSSTGNLGIARTGPSVALEVVGTTTISSGINILGSQLYIGNGITATSSIYGQYGKLGFGSTTPYAQVSIESEEDVVGSTTPIFAVGDQGTSTPFIYVSGNNGFVGIATDSPGAALSVDGNAIFGGNLSVTGVIDVQNSGTTTYAGGVSAAALESTTGGLVVSGGDIVSSGKLTVTSAATSSNSGTFSNTNLLSTGSLFVSGSGTSTTIDANQLVKGNLTVNSGFTLTGGDLLSSGKIVYTGTATSSLAGGLSITSAGGLDADILYNNGAALSVGQSGQNTQVTGAILTLQSVGAGNDIVLSPADGVGISTSTVGLKLEVAGGGVFKGDLTVEGNTRTTNLYATSTIGVATTTPYGLLAVDVTSSVDAKTPAFVIQDSGTSTPSIYVDGGYGRVGFGTSSPMGQVAIEITEEPNNLSNESIPAFIIASRGTSTPIFTVVRNQQTPAVANTNTFSVGIGTTTPYGALSIDTTDIMVGIPALLIRAGATSNVAIQVDSNDVCKDGSTDGACALNDLAELYPTTGDLEPGTIVSFDNTTPVHIKKASINSNNSSIEQRLAGVISTSPAIVFEGGSIKALGGTYKPESGTVPLALSGRVPVKVNLEGGEIKIGDPITLSSEPGVGKKATQSTQIVGYALDNYSGPTEQNRGKIRLFVSNTFWMNNDLIPENEPSWLTQVIDSVSNWLKSAVVAIKEVIADKLTTKELCVGQTCVNEDQLKALLNQTTTQPSNPSPSEPSSSSSPSSDSADTEPPIITLIGNSSVEIEVNSVYSDPGATISDNINQNLGYKVKLDGAEEIYPNDLILNTSVVGDHTITYIAVDQAGNIGTATRTVKIKVPNALQVEASTAPVEISPEIVPSESAQLETVSTTP